MNYRTIAYLLLDKTEDSGLLLTQQQIDYLALKISELPQHLGIQLQNYSEGDIFNKENLQEAVHMLRNDERLILILNLGEMSTSDLIESLTCIVSDLYFMHIDTVDDTTSRLVFEAIYPEDDEMLDLTAQRSQETANSSQAEDIPECLLQKLFGSWIAEKNNKPLGEAYAEALTIFQENGITDEPILLSKDICNQLELAQIRTNADLIRWYREESEHPWHTPHSGPPHIGKVQFSKIGKYINYWFNIEKQALLHNTAPH